MKSYRLYFIVAVVLMVAFATLSKFEDRQFFRSLDFAVTVKVQERIDKSAHLRLSSLVGNVMEGATFVATPGFTSAAIITLTFLAVYDRKRKRFRLTGAVIPIGFVLILLAEIFGKTIIHHPSPPFGMIKHPTTVFPAAYVNEQYSYPSGHAARAVYIAIVSVWLYWRARALQKGDGTSVHIIIPMTLAILYVVFVAVSRVYLGQHWFTDVAGGLLLGAGVGSFIPFFLR